MNSYEIERKLSEKVDKYEFTSLQSENRELRNQINDLERKIGNLEGVNSNRYYVLDRLLTMLIEHPQFSDEVNYLYDLKNNL